MFDYSEAAVQQFGDRAALALGIVGEVGIVPNPHPYPNAERLRSDHAAAIAGGVTAISVYSLDGIVAQPDADQWLDRNIVGAIPSPLETDIISRLMRGLLD